jgi:hypothetical protein
MTWVLLLWNVPFALIVVASLLWDPCADLTAESRSGCAMGAGFLLGLVWIASFVVWLVGLIVLALLWSMRSIAVPGLIALASVGVVAGAWAAIGAAHQLGRGDLVIAAVYSAVAFGGLSLAVVSIVRVRQRSDASAEQLDDERTK